jgi:hypothetical protein
VIERKTNQLEHNNVKLHIKNEVKERTAHLKKTYLEEELSKREGSPRIKFEHLLKKVDWQDFKESMRTKASKKDASIVI